MLRRLSSPMNYRAPATATNTDLFSESTLDVIPLKLKTTKINPGDLFTAKTTGMAQWPPKVQQSVALKTKEKWSPPSSSFQLMPLNMEFSGDQLSKGVLGGT